MDGTEVEVIDAEEEEVDGKDEVVEGIKEEKMEKIQV